VTAELVALEVVDLVIFVSSGVVLIARLGLKLTIALTATVHRCATRPLLIFIGIVVFVYIAQMGSQIIIPYRGDDYYVRELKTAGEIGQKLFLVIFYFKYYVSCVSVKCLQGGL